MSNQVNSMNKGLTVKDLSLIHISAGIVAVSS